MRHFMVLALLALATTGCKSNLDAAATAQNATNVRTLVAHVDELHVKAASDPSLRHADAEAGASFIKLADEMSKAAGK